MTQFLIKRFIKDPENIRDEKVRLAYGTLTSAIGMCCNIFLFILKGIIGLTIHSISIVSDGFNNLSDCMSCLITLFGYRLSAKPADKEHPFGHGRMEYVVSFIVAIIIFIFGFQLLTTSIDKIIHPDEVSFNLVLVVILAASILVKVWMAFFYKSIGTKINNLAIKAASDDSRNDVLATAISLIAIILSAVTKDIPFDGIAGVILACFIFYSGYGIAIEIINQLLGAPASKELTAAIRNQMLSHKEIVGVHDMIIHDYGPGVQIGSAHAEVNAKMDFLAAHDVIDEAEREIEENLHVMMTIHMDPIIVDDPQLNEYKKMVDAILNAIDPNLSMHDFRMVSGPMHTNLVFDILVPYDEKLSNAEIKDKIDAQLAGKPVKFYTVIHFDRGFISEEDE
ncbi:MAG: cation diffusion facilitator family transporter [Solobacterium sp.]|jgi:cation diffusion facilitator family transporter|nr:cation diffusion facilitator family transporter [Solobacterium sp.]MCH4227683.1 cation diffusion facilitator family transporter [Solobacterium sp.]MCH4283110.1 cation diffusion facilitator family transporter [Solobacterium sp.]